jgi:GNAT superfamily N-acetyltransferase
MGVGSALIEAVESEARRHQCFRLEVTCRPERKEAHAFYGRLGFRDRPHRFVREIP